MVRLCGLALVGAVSVLLLREHGSKWSALAGVAAGILLLFELLERYRRILAPLGTLSENALLSDCFSLSLRALGIAMLTAFSADVCRQMGEAALAGRVEMLGRAEILLAALPTLLRILELSRALAGGA